MATFIQAVSSQHFARYYITATIAMVAIEELLAGQDTLDFDRLKRLGLLEQVQSKVPAKEIYHRETQKPVCNVAYHKNTLPSYWKVKCGGVTPLL